VPVGCTVTVAGMVFIVVLPHVMVIVSPAVKPTPVISVARPVDGASVIVGVTGVAVTVKVAVFVAIWVPLELAVAVTVHIPVKADALSLN